MEALGLSGIGKKHRASKTGVKAKKKSDKDKKKRGLSTERYNPKAFSVSNIVRTKRTQQRNLDRAQKKELVPLVDRTDDLPPPALVVVMGPNGVGKSTLIRSLVKIYSNQNLTDTTGPITVVAGKKRRITFFECPSDIFSMTDLAKVADLVLLMVDGSYGFEMETFEYLNLLQLHGFPKVMGVLTHLDKFKLNKTLQKTKKRLKQRFWTEIYKGAKMFEFTGIVNGKYPKHESKRLALHISRVKFRPLVWRNTHPFLLVDRVEDITPVSTITNDPSCNRDVTLYGYVRGTHLKDSMRIHLVGVGDYDISSLTVVDDPCPLPGQTEKLSLKTKGALLYAPLANIGRVKMDQDGVYIDLKYVHYTKPDLLLSMEQSSNNFNNNSHHELVTNKEGFSKTPAGLLRSMQDVKVGLDQRIDRSELSLFTNSSAVKGQTIPHKQLQQQEEEEEEKDEYDDDDSDQEDDVSDEGDDVSDQEDDDNDEEYSDEENDDDDNDNDEDEDEDDIHPQSPSKNQNRSNLLQTVERGSEWKEGMAAQAVSSFLKRSASTSATDLMQLVYGNQWSISTTTSTTKNTSSSTKSFNHSSNSFSTDNDDDNNDDNDDPDELFTWKSTSQQKEYQSQNRMDSNKSKLSDEIKDFWMTTLAAAANAAASTSSSSPTSSSHKKIGKGKDKRQRSQDVLGFAEIRNRFVTGNWNASSGSTTGTTNDNNNSDEEVYGDFEDLEVSNHYSNNNSSTTHDSDDSNDEDEDNDDNSLDDDNENDMEEEEEDEEEIEEEEEEEEVDSEAENDLLDQQLQRQINANKKAKSRTSQEGLGGAGGGGGIISKENMDLDDSLPPSKNEEEAEEEKVAELASQRAQMLRQRNKAEFGEDGALARHQLEGLHQGVYCRLVLRGVPREFTTGFRPRLPVIVGGLLPHESAMGIISARVKRHRWHRRVLKSNDPLIFSVGWRRYQSLPVYSLEDPDDRQRYLKYTPEHMHCHCHFYGPLIPPNTGILAYQKTSRSHTGFRISLTGTAIEIKSNPSIVKKLKLVGTPFKIFKNTAFVSGMFNSELEVAKFEGAKIKTVSGIRGQIKRPVKEGEPGSFRASFEDKILKSDIIFCRLWVPVELTKYYNPVTSLLTAPRITSSGSGGNVDSSNNNDDDDDELKEDEEEEEDDDEEGVYNSNSNKKELSLKMNAMKSAMEKDQEALGDWQGMRPIAQIRREDKIPIVVNKDSIYRPIERTPRQFRSLTIPKKLQEALPFATKPKLLKKQNPESYLVSRRAVIVEPEERKRRAALVQLATIGNERIAKRKVAQGVRSEEKKKKRKVEEEKFADVHHDEKRKRYATQGMESARRAKAKRT